MISYFVNACQYFLSHVSQKNNKIARIAELLDRKPNGCMMVYFIEERELGESFAPSFGIFPRDGYILDMEQFQTDIKGMSEETKKMVLDHFHRYDPRTQLFYVFILNELKFSRVKKILIHLENFYFFLGFFY